MSDLLPIVIPHQRQAEIESRFLDGLARSSKGCWEWQRRKHSNGYGKFSIDRRKLRAHRVAYVLFCGPIPGTLRVLHDCDNPACCNPTHLFLGTQADNLADMRRKGRHRLPPTGSRGPRGPRPLLRGEKHPLAKLREEQVRLIRSLHGMMGYKAIAKRFGVSQVTVLKIVKRQLWGWLD